MSKLYWLQSSTGTVSVMLVCRKGGGNLAGRSVFLVEPACRAIE